MAKLALVYLLGLFCSAFAALPTFTDLAPGIVVTAALTQTLSSDAAKHDLHYYRYFVPSNVKTLSVSSQATAGTTCLSLVMYADARTVPCGQEWSPNSGATYPCQSNPSTTFSTSSSSLALFPSDSYSEEISFQPGDYVYITVGRYYTASDYNNVCSYSITLTATFCAVGEVASFDTVPVCYAENTVTLPFAGTVSSTTAWAYNKVWIPENTASIHFWSNATTYQYVYGESYFAPGTYSAEYYCYDSSTSTSGGYLTDLTCYVPPTGWFHWGITESSSTTVSAVQVMIDIKTCTGAMAGWNCTYPVTNFTVTPLAITANTIQPATTTFEPQDYFVVSTMNGTDAYYNFTATMTSAATSGYIYYRRNAVPDGSVSDGYFNYQSLTTGTAETYALSWHDVYRGGNFYFGVENYGAGVLTYSASSTSAAGGSSSTTAASSTTGGSSAGTVVASFGLIAMMLALLF